MNATEEKAQQINDRDLGAPTVQASSIQNIAGTESKSVTGLTQPRSLDVHAVRKQLDALRAKHGADTPAGHRCSNLIEQLKVYPISFGKHRIEMEKNIADSVADLAKLSAA